jgi:hypothetical protein
MAGDGANEDTPTLWLAEFPVYLEAATNAKWAGYCEIAEKS